MAVHLTRRRFTIDEYHQMAEAGILGEDDRVELIDGEIVEMTPIGRRHAACVDRLNQLLVLRFSDVAQVAVQNPVHLGEHSEPEPDLALLHRRSDFYDSALRTPDAVLLLVEVGETSADLDRKVKVPLYARHSIPELWLVNLKEETITVYREPSSGSYQNVRVVRRGEELAPALFPERTMSGADLLG